jgi:hypothetical protein
MRHEARGIEAKPPKGRSPEGDVADSPTAREARRLAQSYYIIISNILKHTTLDII